MGRGRWAIAFAAALAISCGGSTTTSNGDGGHEGATDGGQGAQDAPKDHAEPQDHATRDVAPTDSNGEAAPPDAAGGCHSMSDCPAGSYEGCLQFTLAPTCGGVCTGSPYTGGCTSDADCADAGAGFICSSFCQCPFTGGYDPMGPWCIKGCTSDPECGPGYTCSAAHHCEATSCKVAGDCGANFVCSMGACAPASCKDDSGCKNGWFCTTQGFDEGCSTQRYCSPHLGVCMTGGA